MLPWLMFCWNSWPSLTAFDLLIWLLIADLGIYVMLEDGAAVVVAVAYAVLTAVAVFAFFYAEFCPPVKPVDLFCFCAFFDVVWICVDLLLSIDPWKFGVS